MDKIAELGRHEPSVDSVIERLDRHRGKIDNITAVVTWSNGESQVVHDSKPLSDLAYEGLVLTNYLNSVYNGEEEEA